MNLRIGFVMVLVAAALQAQVAKSPASAPSKARAAPSAQAIVAASARDLTLVAPAAPGGGWDQTARVIQEVLRTSGLAKTVRVVNTPGAAGTIGLARFVNAEAGNPNSLLVMGLVMVSGIAANHSPVTLADVTPIARLSGEYEVIVVPKASPFRTLADLITAFKADPRSISWGGGSAGGTDEILVRLVADAVNVPRDSVNYIAYSGGGQALAAVLGAHVSAAVSGPGEFASQIESGDLRALAVSAPDRIDISEGEKKAARSERAPAPRSPTAIPTLREQGVDITLLNWRGVVAPPGISRNERRALETLIANLAATPQWKAALVRGGWTDITLVGAPFAKFIADETRRVAPLVAGVGAGGRGSRDWFGMFVMAGLLLAAAVTTVQWTRVRPHRAAQSALAAMSAEPLAGAPKANSAALALVAGAIVLDIALIRPAGFVIAASLMFALVARAFGSRRPRRDVIVGMLMAAIIFFAFSRGLGVSLPAGPFG